MSSGLPVAVVASRVRVDERMLLDALAARQVPHVVIDDRMLTHRIGAPAPAWSAVVNRSISASRRLEVSRLCEAWGIPVVNPVATVTTCDSKIATLLALHAAGLPTPDTVVALTPAALVPTGAAPAGGMAMPLVVKPASGSWGRGLCRVNDIDALEGVLELRAALPSPQQHLVLAQEFVHTPHRDVRVLVAGDRVVAACHRSSEHWITNVARGARTSACAVDPGLADLAVRAAKAVGGGFLGVDLLERVDGGIAVNEVNAGTEFRGLAEATGVAVGDALVDHVLEKVRS